ncbi:MAG: OmpA family protein [Chitinophagaceae bacterium]|nr:OmpA family protein [Chitinophagaceae bacterium]
MFRRKNLIVPLKRLFYITTLLLSFFSFRASGQYDPSKIKTKAGTLYSQALNRAGEGEYREAIKMLEDAVKIEPKFLDAYLSLGGVYGELKEYRNAVENYEKAKAIDSIYFRDYALPYSINLAGLGEFEKARDAANMFLSIKELNPSSIKAGEYRKQCYEFAIEYAKRKSVSDYKFEPKNLGDSINSKVSEYFPAITIDGSQLFYTRRVNSINEDFYESSLVDNTWRPAKSLPGDINTMMNEGAQNISQDGEWLIFTGCNFPEGYGSCDLYISYLTPQGWSAPENLGSNINTESWDSAPSLSPDKRDLYFASNRPGGMGKSDIYVCHRNPDGTWTEPKNAGPQINTSGNESGPFIHADNQTLYFTSDGHPGYGGDDLFLVKKLPGNKWGPAENLGYPINTIENEGSLIIAADGKTAYYASDRSDSKGGLDLYTFELRSDVRPLKTLWVKGKVFDAKSKKGLPSAVELTDLETQEVLSRVQTDETGSYLVTLPVGKDYAFNVNRRGYLFFSENFSLKDRIPDSTYNIDIPLEPLHANATVVLKNVFFDINKSELKPESFAELDNIVKLLKENPTLKISINGHTDNIGKPADNLKLSNSRANAVVHYLVEKGIAANRLSSKGWGETQPVAANDNEEGKAKNRRTEMKVVN